MRNPKFFGVVTDSQGNIQITPWFSTPDECRQWSSENGKQYSAILPATNWEETQDWQAQHNETVWPVLS